LNPERLYTTGEVAKTFGVSYVAVKKWAYSGKIKYIKALRRGSTKRQGCDLCQGKLGDQKEDLERQKQTWA